MKSEGEKGKDWRERDFQNIKGVAEHVFTAFIWKVRFLHDGTISKWDNSKMGSRDHGTRGGTCFGFVFWIAIFHSIYQYSPIKPK